ncbi:hypothetical protein HPB49_013121 [Dermacentor silvarum]|uniref:Uncharacterized protein n=1 Tax=Dermacentor silvarum TaxID=543639 RepID=A0ACB8D5L7_DERSI|nr:hypothetical protein HPB49_013121 [Dermacentor silvarum]
MFLVSNFTVTEDRGKVRCSPVTYFVSAGLLLLFFVGFSLFMFVSMNTGNAAGFEVTAEPEPEPERRVGERSEMDVAGSAENDSEPRYGDGSGTNPKSRSKSTEGFDKTDEDSNAVTGRVPEEEKLHETATRKIRGAATATTDATTGTTSTNSVTTDGRQESSSVGLPEAGLRPSGGGGPQQLPARSLVCVLGGRSEEYGSMAVDGLCDVVLAPFYTLPGGDTFLNDGHVVTQAVLEMAAKSIKTTYGIHVPLKYARDPKLLQVRNDLMRQKAQDRMKAYWIEHNVYHYAVLDLEIGANGTDASNIVGRVFTVLKLFAKVQEAIRKEVSSERKSEAQPDAYVILGVHLWMATNDKLFKALRKHVRSFTISALIARTHTTEHDHDGCKTNGPAPYEIENNDHIMGMRTSLAVSFTLCARWYRPKKQFLVGVDCIKDAMSVSSSGAVCSEKPDFFANQAVDKTQHTAFSWQIPDLMATYDTADTMQWKASGRNFSF